MFEPLPEIFYQGTYKKEIYQRYKKIEGLPPEVLKLLDEPNKTQNWGKKSKEYKEELNLIIGDVGIRTKLIEAIVNHNLKNDADIIIPFAPLIKDQTSFFLSTVMYDQTKRMFLGGLTNVEEVLGKRLALYLCIHKSALGNNKLILEITRYVTENPHQAIVMKILLTDDKSIKELSYVQTNNLLKLIKCIGLYSKLNRVPSHLLCTNTLGLIGIANGIDSFSQPMTEKEREIEVAFGKEARQILSENNPKYIYGKIYCYEARQFIPYSNYVDFVEANEFELPSPAREYSGTIEPNRIKDMAKLEFYEHARMTLLESRNYEIDELMKAISNKEIRGYKSRFKSYFNNVLLPQ